MMVSAIKIWIRPRAHIDLVEPTWERVIAGSTLGPSYARSPISSQAQFPAQTAAISILHLRKQYRLQAPTLILQTWQTEEQEENEGGEHGSLPSGSAAQAENADDEVVAAVLAVMRRKNGSPLPS
ncbi:hypothetical protein OIU78_018963 [Salix suchowensis]|nr:hypothetical protein OIU78_018963 [Salix suchowensis]